MAGAVISTVSNLLKDVYLPPVVEQLVNEVELFSRIENKSDAELVGNQVLNSDPDICGCEVIEAIAVDNIEDTEGHLVHLTDAEVASVPADRSPVDDVDTGSIREGGIDNGAAVGDGTFDPFSHLDDKFIKLTGDLEFYDRFKSFEDLVFNKDRAHTVAGNIFDVGVSHQGVDLSESN